MEVKKPEQQGAAKIGHGVKLHKAVLDGTYGLMIVCGCPGTQNGSAYHRARFFANVQPNCRVN